MNDPDVSTLKNLIEQAISACTDVNTLDLIYRLLIYDDMQEAGL